MQRELVLISPYTRRITKFVWQELSRFVAFSGSCIGVPVIRSTHVLQNAQGSITDANPTRCLQNMPTTKSLRVELFYFRVHQLGEHVNISMKTRWNLGRNVNSWILT